MNTTLARLESWCQRIVPSVLRRYGKPFGWYSDGVERWIYPYTRSLSWLGWLVNATVLGVAAILLAHMAGELVAGVAVAVVILMAVLDWIGSIESTGGHLARWFVIAWLLAAVGLAGIEQPAAVSAMLSDGRLMPILGALAAAMVVLILLNAFGVLAVSYHASEWRAKRRVARIAAATGIPADVVDRVLMEFDHEQEGYDADWELVATSSIHESDWRRREQERKQRRAERKARRAAR